MNHIIDSKKNHCYKSNILIAESFYVKYWLNTEKKLEEKGNHKYTIMQEKERIRFD